MSESVTEHLYLLALPRSAKDKQPMRKFWEKRNEWFPTWNKQQGTDVSNALQVDYIRVYELETNWTWYWYMWGLFDNSRSLFRK